MKIYVALVLTALVSSAAFADELSTQRAAVKSKLSQAAPAIPTGVEVPGDGLIYIEAGRVVRYDCKRTKDFLTREPCWSLGGGSSVDANSSPSTK